MTYLLAAAALVPLSGSRAIPSGCSVLGPLVAFFGTGYFSGFSAIASELFPTEIRATAMGLTYNLGRGLSAAAPAVIGLLAARVPASARRSCCWPPRSSPPPCSRCLPETKGRRLD